MAVPLAVVCFYCWLLFLLLGGWFVVLWFCCFVLVAWATCDSQFLAPRSAIRTKGVRFGNPETIRENQAIRTNLRIDSRESGHLRVNQKAADVWEKDVWEFQAKSGSSGSCCLFLYFRGKIAVQDISGKAPGSPRHPSSRHLRPSE